MPLLISNEVCKLHTCSFKCLFSFSMNFCLALFTDSTYDVSCPSYVKSTELALLVLFVLLEFRVNRDIII